MGYKDVCLTCRKAFNRGTNVDTPKKAKCSECGNETVSVNHKFQPPRKLDKKKWEVVAYLIEHGFRYDHVYEEICYGLYLQYGRYPENMNEAKEFVESFDNKGIKRKKPVANNAQPSGTVLKSKHSLLIFSIFILPERRLLTIDHTEAYLAQPLIVQRLFYVSAAQQPPQGKAQTHAQRK